MKTSRLPLGCRVVISHVLLYQTPLLLLLLRPLACPRSWSNKPPSSQIMPLILPPGPCFAPSSCLPLSSWINPFFPLRSIKLYHPMCNSDHAKGNIRTKSVYLSVCAPPPSCLHPAHESMRMCGTPSSALASKSEALQLSGHRPQRVIRYILYEVSHPRYEMSESLCPS